MNSKNSTLQSILLHIAEEDIPASEINIWSDLQKNLAQSKKSTQREGLPVFTSNIKRKRYQYGAIVGLLILMFATILLFTPEGRAFAQQILGFFVPIQQTSFPAPEPALTAQANPDQQNQAEAPMPTSISALVCPQTNSEGKYLCDMAYIQEQIGNRIKVLPFNYGGLEYRRFIIDRLPPSMEIILTLEYGPAPYGALSIMQGQGGFPLTLSVDGSDDHWSEVPVEYIQPVTVNRHPGEYAEGGFVQMVGSDKFTWNPEIQMARLRWKDGDTWFQVSRPGVPEVLSDVIGTKESMVKLAESLVYADEIVQGK